jgi:hypothetical protein
MYKLKSSSNPTKGMIFAGCSFTWAQGLWYYSGLPDYDMPLGRYYSEIVRHSHLYYTHAHRFPRLVANHFNTFEVCQECNGGAHDTIIPYWKKMIDVDNKQDLTILNSYGSIKYDLEDFSHIIFQFTQWQRSIQLMPSKPVNKSISDRTLCHFEVIEDSNFLQWLDDNNFKDIDEYIDKSIRHDLKNVKNFLQEFDDRGLKSYVLTWPEDLVPYINQDDWLSKRFIKFHYKNSTYDNLEVMMAAHNTNAKCISHPELTIYHDKETFEISPQDEHPSITCHKMIADSIIKHLKNE